MLGEFARHQPGALEIGVEDVIPFLFGMLQHRLGDDDARIVDEDAQRPELGLGGCDGRGDAVRPGNIAGDRQALGLRAASISRAASARRSTRRAASATLAPAAASSSARWRPIPLEAPVTSAT